MCWAVVDLIVIHELLISAAALPEFVLVAIAIIDTSVWHHLAGVFGCAFWFANIRVAVVVFRCGCINYGGVCSWCVLGVFLSFFTKNTHPSTFDPLNPRIHNNYMFVTKIPSI